MLRRKTECPDADSGHYSASSVTVMRRSVSIAFPLEYLGRAVLVVNALNGIVFYYVNLTLSFDS